MTQKVAYVTGGMGGIGTAICQRLHKEGFKVIAGCGPTRDHAKWIAEQAALLLHACHVGGDRPRPARVLNILMASHHLGQVGR